jgi:urease accessory protein
MATFAARALWSVAAIAFALPASAHVDASHVASAFADSGFFSGLLHPLSGIDHLLTILAVGIWASQHQGKVRQTLALMFPSMMVVGALFGSTGLPIPGMDLAIAFSVALLALLIAGSIKVSPSVSAPLVACLALVHGYQHAVEMNAAHAFYGYCAGFTVSTVLILVAGFTLGRRFHGKPTMAPSFPRSAEKVARSAG